MKLKTKNLNKLINSLTGREIDFYLYLIKRQSDAGCVDGVNHRDIKKDLNMPRSTFYVVLEGLREKGFVYVDWSNRNRDFDIRLIDNLFLSKGDFKEGYVNINLDFILSEQFLLLNVNLKKFFMRILGLQGASKPVKLLTDTLRRYKVYHFMPELMKIFDIVEDGDLYFIQIKYDLIHNSQSSKYLSYRNKLINYCKDYKIKYTEFELHHSVKAIINFIGKKRTGLVNRALDAIRRIGSLQPKLISHICKPVY